jgi:DNA-nicking Smr family endonuclease
MSKLSDLKKLLDQAGRTPRTAGPTLAAPVAPPTAAASVARAVAASKHADGDVDMANAYAGVRPMPPPKRAKLSRPAPAPIPKQRIADDRDALEESKYGSDPAPDAWDIGQEQEAGQTFLRRGMGLDVLTKLRRGHWSVQSELDLHGHTSVEAHDALADFLEEARTRGARCVRVIHGKGLTSPNKVPVLKGKVRIWLSQWDDVLAYSEASPNSGGGGAVMILLRGK